MVSLYLPQRLLYHPDPQHYRIPATPVRHPRRQLDHQPLHDERSHQAIPAGVRVPEHFRAQYHPRVRERLPGEAVSVAEPGQPNDRAGHRG